MLNRTQKWPVHRGLATVYSTVITGIVDMFSLFE